VRLNTELDAVVIEDASDQTGDDSSAQGATPAWPLFSQRVQLGASDALMVDAKQRRFCMPVLLHQGGVYHLFAFDSRSELASERSDQK
jgi:hypothetical protein